MYSSDDSVPALLPVNSLLVKEDSCNPRPFIDFERLFSNPLITQNRPGRGSSNQQSKITNQQFRNEAHVTTNRNPPLSPYQGQWHPVRLSRSAHQEVLLLPPSMAPIPPHPTSAPGRAHYLLRTASPRRRQLHPACPHAGYPPAALRPHRSQDCR